MFNEINKLFVTLLMAMTLVSCKANGPLFTMNIGDLRTEAEVVNKFVETICANPLVATHLTLPERQQLSLVEDKVQNVLVAMESEEKENVSIDLGKNWSKYLVTDLQQILSVLQPIGPELTPALNHYIQLGYAVIEILQTLGSTNLNTPDHTASMIAIVPENRDKINLEVWEGPQS